jgi:phosphohistidine phosphatase
MAQRILSKKITPQLLLSSPANRAFTTCKMIAFEIGYPLEDIQTDEALYHAGEETILAVVKRIPDSVHVALLFGHNPGLTDFVCELTDEQINNIPTCGMAFCEMNVDKWSDSIWGCGELRHFDYPKKQS